ncbi:MAG: AVAST type 1 anti-phage system MBL fold metallo-hydrolase Avs1a [Bacteroidota bacterium]
MTDFETINFRAFPALNGDCLLITCKSQGQQKNILIDCGYPDTYREHLLPELRKVSWRGGQIDLFIVTHIDADHLMGAIPFLKDNNIEQFIGIEQVWHNTFRHIQPLIGINANAAVKQPVLQALIQRGYHTEKQTSGEISAHQGTTVGALILKNNYQWNTDFQGKAVSTDNGGAIYLSDQVSIFLLSPGPSELIGLARFWQQELKKYDLNISPADDQYFDDAFEMMLTWEKNMPKQPKPIYAVTTPEALLNKPFKEDTGVTNGSSIGFILEMPGKNLLLLGDAHPAVIERGLIKYQPEGTIVFDLIKLAHHGSYNNISLGLLQRTDSSIYVFSANGKHGHPDKETIAHIVCRKADFLRTLYFNYQTESSEFFNREDWKRAYHYEIAYLSVTDYTLTL